MLELNWAIYKLAPLHRQHLYKMYQDALDNAVETDDDQEQYLMKGLETHNRMFSSVYNDQSNMVLLLLCDKYSQSNVFYVGQLPVPYSILNSPMCHGKHPQIIHLSVLTW